MLSSIMENCGKIIKKVAAVFAALCLTGAVGVLVAELANSRKYLMGSVAVTVIVVAFLVVGGGIGGLIIYGFGEIVDCVKDIRDQGRK